MHDNIIPFGSLTSRASMGSIIPRWV